MLTTTVVDHHLLDRQLEERLALVRADSEGVLAQREAAHRDSLESLERRLADSEASEAAQKQAALRRRQEVRFEKPS